MSVAALERILRSATIDQLWAVILNEAKRNEESLLSVADLKKILRSAEAGLRMTGLASCHCLKNLWRMPWLPTS